MFVYLISSSNKFLCLVPSNIFVVRQLVMSRDLLPIDRLTECLMENGNDGTR